jgi:hypothetical protein
MAHAIQITQRCHVADERQRRASIYYITYSSVTFKNNALSTALDLSLQQYQSYCQRVPGTHKLVNLTRLEKLLGMGPWKEFPWSLLKTYIFGQ